MAYIFLVGFLVIVMFIAAVLLFKRNASIGEKELCWKNSVIHGLLMYLLSMVLGAILTTLFMNSSQGLSIPEWLKEFVLGSLAILVYAMLFSFFIVLPGLIFSLKFISGKAYSRKHKHMLFSSVCLLLVVFMNAMLTGLIFGDPGMMLLIAGFAVSGILLPPFYVWYKKIF
jgi:hypothetical protein